MTKIELLKQIDILITRIRDHRNSVFTLQPIAEDVYRLITGRKDFNIIEHLETDLDDGEQNIRRGQMIQLLEGLKEQLDLFIIDAPVKVSPPRKQIGFI